MSGDNESVDGIDSTAEMMLARQAQSGDREAWQQLVEKHIDSLCAYLGTRLRRHKLVQKLAADTTFAGWRHISEWEPGKEPFATWFRRLGARVTLGYRQKHQDMKVCEPFPVAFCETAAQKERMPVLEEALGRIGEKHRMCLEQHFRAGLEGRALGEVLHCQAAEADALIDDALDALAAELEACNG